MHEVVRTTGALQNRPSPLSWPRSPAATITERLYDALAEAKLMTSRTAMYLDSASRTRLFRQLDALLDPAEWDDDDAPLRPDSFNTFLKAMLQLMPERPPGLGLSNAGDLVAAWTSGEDRLTIEFRPEDRVRWVLSRREDGEIERIAGETTAARLAASLQGHHPAHWFDRG